MNGASCVDQLNRYACNCVAGYTGSNCVTGACAAELLHSFNTHGELNVRVNTLVKSFLLIMATLCLKCVYSDVFSVHFHLYLFDTNI